jgi:hypothetical protein
MEQEPIPWGELFEFEFEFEFEFILFLGSATFLSGGLFQGFILYRNKKDITESIAIITGTRVLTALS